MGVILDPSIWVDVERGRLAPADVAVVAKTGARRQTDLVRRLLQGPAGLARRPAELAPGSAGVVRRLRRPDVATAPARG